MDTAFRAAHEAALRFLSYRPRSEAEVRRRLLRRYPLDAIEQVVAALREQRGLDDATFARYWRENRERHRPRSQWAIRQELLRLGVSREEINKALEGFDAPANAYRAGAKLAPRLADAEYPLFRQRLTAYLQRRGFDRSSINQTVERLWRELAEDSLNGEHNSQKDEQKPEDTEAEVVQ